MKISIRLIYSISTTGINIMPTVVGATKHSHIGNEIAVFLICSILASSFATMQWERKKQEGDLNSLASDLISVAISLAAFIILMTAINKPILIREPLLFAALIFLNLNSQVFLSKIAATGDLAKFLNAIQIKILLTAAPTLWILLQPKVSFADFLLINFLFTTILAAYGIFRYRPKKHLNWPEIDKASIHLTVVEFTKGQTWILLSWAFFHSTTLAMIYLMRQALGPIAIIMASKRSSIFDAALAGKTRPVIPHNALLIQYAIVTLISAIIIFIALHINIIDYQVGLIGAAWLTLIIAQDYRAYFNRTELIGLAMGAWIIIIPVATILSTTSASLSLGKINISYLITSVAVSELAIVVLFLIRISNADRKN